MVCRLYCSSTSLFTLGAGDNQKSLKALGIPSTGEVTIRTLPEKSCFTPVYSDTAKPKVLNPHSVGYKTLERESKGWGSDIGFVGDSVNGMVEVNIQGPEKTPFAGFTIVCHIEVNQNYPFEPPHLSVATPIQHPNIDAAGKVFGLRFSEENGFDDTGDARVGPAQWHSSFTVEKLVRIMIKTLKNPNLQDYFADPKAWNSLEQDSAQEFMQAQQVNTGEE